MAIDTSFMRKKIEKCAHLYVLFSPFTHLPYVECDEETFDDEVFVFTSEEMTQVFAKTYAGRKIALQAMRIPQKMYKNFFAGLYALGVSAVMYQEEGAPIRVALSDLAEKPKPEEAGKETIPVFNPEMQLTGIYFMQELRRPVTRDAEEKKHLKELEEEMAHNLLQATFIIPFDVTDVKEGEKIFQKDSHARQPMIRTKDDRAFLPVFTELGEFKKFASRFSKPQTKMRLVPVPAAALLRFLPKGAAGFCVNPAGFNMLLTKELLDRLQKLYGEEGAEQE